ncbi:MAG: DUF1330 domain-containing protein [Mycobacterium sp.]
MTSELPGGLSATAEYFVVAALDEIDGDSINAYAVPAAATITRFGGRVAAVLDLVETLEGSPDTSRLVVIAFKDREAANAWYGSQDYAELIPRRHAAATTRFFAGFRPVS